MNNFVVREKMKETFCQLTMKTNSNSMAFQRKKKRQKLSNTKMVGIRESRRTAKSMEKEFSNGMMELNMMGIGWMTRGMERESSTGLMELISKDHGWMTKSMDKAQFD